VNVADLPTVTVWFVGCVVIVAAPVTCAAVDLAPRIEEKNSETSNKHFFPSELGTVLSLCFYPICLNRSRGGLLRCFDWRVRWKELAVSRFLLVGPFLTRMARFFVRVYRAIPLLSVLFSTYIPKSKQICPSRLHLRTADPLSDEKLLGALRRGEGETSLRSMEKKKYAQPKPWILPART